MNSRSPKMPTSLSSVHDRERRQAALEHLAHGVADRVVRIEHRGLADEVVGQGARAH